VARGANRGNPMQTGTGKTYPSVGFERLHKPSGGPAIDQTGARVAVWRRAAKIVRTGAIAGGLALAALITLIAAAGTLPGFVVFLLVMLLVVGGLIAVGCALSLIATVQIWRTLRRTSWSVYSCKNMTMREGAPVQMTLEQGASRFPVRFRNSKRAEVLRGMPWPEVWFAGDPARGGVLTQAGGGEMFLARAVKARPVKVRNTKPRKPPKVKPVNPRKAQRDAERARKARAKAQERARIRAEKLAKNPPKPPKPRKPPKPPRIPRGGQKIKFPGM
jgi:hypothetical protein